MTDEIWKPVRGCEGFYEVSNTGKVKSLRRGIILKQQVNNQGYNYVYLKFCGPGKSYIHRLVADAFIKNENPLENTVVNHLDFNPQNNHYSNLEWTSPINNYNYSYNRGRYARTDAWRQKLTQAVRKRGKAVLGINIKTGEKIIFQCLNDCKKDGFEPSCICDCCKKKRKTHKGYAWEYAKK